MVQTFPFGGRIHVSNVAYRATVHKTGAAADYNCVKRPGNPPHFAIVHCADKSTTQHPVFIFVEQKM